MKQQPKNIDPGKPGLYEVHILYKFGRNGENQYIVVLINAPNFAKAYELATIQVKAIAGYSSKAFIEVANLINLITDPVAYLTQH